MGRLKTLGVKAQRLSVKLLVLAFVLTLGAQLLPTIASATSQVTVRKIVMSSSTPSATNVTYAVTFTPPADTPTTHPDVIIDFCDNTPIIGDSCTATAGTDVPNFTSAAAAGWTLTTIGTNRGVKLTTASVNFVAATPVTITITGVVNPSNVGANGTFYGRILDYATGGAGANTSVSPGSYVDYGGIALSTASNINITSKVFETLTFCVFQTSCGTPAVLTLGDPTTGALSSSNAYDNSNAQYTLATNAGSGVSVTMTGTTLCRPGGTCITSGDAAHTISAIGSTPLVIATGTEQFGMCVDKNSSADLTVAAKYIDTINNCHSLGTGVYAGTSKFGFDDTAATGTNNAAGDQILSSSGPVTSITGTFAFLCDIATTTEAGIYTTSLNMVATGTF